MSDLTYRQVGDYMVPNLEVELKAHLLLIQEQAEAREEKLIQVLEMCIFTCIVMIVLLNVLGAIYTGQHCGDWCICYIGCQNETYSYGNLQFVCIVAEQSDLFP